MDLLPYPLKCTIAKHNEHRNSVSVYHKPDAMNICVHVNMLGIDHKELKAFLKNNYSYMVKSITTFIIWSES